MWNLEKVDQRSFLSCTGAWHKEKACVGYSKKGHGDFLGWKTLKPHGSVTFRRFNSRKVAWPTEPAVEIPKSVAQRKHKGFDDKNAYSMGWFQKWSDFIKPMTFLFKPIIGRIFPSIDGLHYTLTFHCVAWVGEDSVWNAWVSGISFHDAWHCCISYRVHICVKSLILCVMCLYMSMSI